MYKIPLSVPSLKGNELQYVKECIDIEWVSSSGKYVDLFEQKIAKYTESKYAIACVNGTSALQLSLRLSGVQPGDEVIVPALTFIAPVNVIAYNNANPIFMDADEYYNIDTEKTIEFIINKTEFTDGFTYNKLTKNFTDPNFLEDHSFYIKINSLDHLIKEIESFSKKVQSSNENQLIDQKNFQKKLLGNQYDSKDLLYKYANFYMDL